MPVKKQMGQRLLVKTAVSTLASWLVILLVLAVAAALTASGKLSREGEGTAALLAALLGGAVGGLVQAMWGRERSIPLILLPVLITAALRLVGALLAGSGFSGEGLAVCACLLLGALPPALGLGGRRRRRR
ncbi:MAG: hypothetical protein ACSW8F_00015 [bacterium]